MGKIEELLKQAELFEKLALSPLARGEHVVQDVMDAAENYVVSVFSGKTDVRELHKLKAANEKLASLARWFTTNKQPNANAAHMLSRAASQLPPPKGGGL
jgi:5'(3')-deoxyribonucleotidase